jgi:HEAT repeat protein
MVRRLGAAAATPEVLAALLGMLRDRDKAVRPRIGFGDTAIKMVRRLGAAAATPEVLAALLGMLRDPHLEVRGDAASVLAEFFLQGLRLFGWVSNASTLGEFFSQGLRLLGYDPQLRIRRVEDLAQEQGP